MLPSLSSAVSGEPLFKAGLWNYLREDMTFSLMNRCPLKVEIGRVDIALVRDDDYANQITLLLARVINAVFSGGKELLRDLHSLIEEWYTILPFRAYHNSDRGGFPKVQMIQNCHGGTSEGHLLHSSADAHSCCTTILAPGSLIIG